MSAVSDASAWVRRWAHLIRPGGQVLDVACGRGRHLRWLHAQGFQPTGVDRDRDAVEGLASLARIVVADLEGGPWPLPGERFDAVVVTNYLWRPQWPALRDALAPGGVLLYETFADGQQTIGRPSRPDFLLQPGELLSLAQGLRVVAFEDGFEDGLEGGLRDGGTPDANAAPRFVQRIAAVAQDGDAGGPAPTRHRLAGPWRGGR